MDVTLGDGSILQGGEWPGVPWYPDMPETGAAEICLGLSKFARDSFLEFELCKTSCTPVDSHLAHHVKLQTSI